MPSLRLIKPRGLMPQWGDSLSAVSYGGYIHVVGQAQQAIYPSKKHYVFDTSGNIIADITAPFIANAEMNLSLLDGKIWAYGGGSADMYNIWNFDPARAGLTASSWVNQNTTAPNDHSGGVATGRIMAVGADGPDGNHWLFGGLGLDTYCKTALFTSGNWTNPVGTLPNAIKKLSANAICVVGNEIILIGGSSNSPTPDATGLYASQINGHVYGYNVLTNTFRLIYTNKQLFGSIWIDAAASATNVYVSKGWVSTEHIASFPVGTAPRPYPGNVRGIVYSPKSDLTSWTELEVEYGNYIYHERHRTAMVYHSGKVYILAGYNGNDMWVIDE